MIKQALRATFGLLLCASTVATAASSHAVKLQQEPSRQRCDTGLASDANWEDFDFPALGIARHRSTGLVWQRCLVGQSWRGDKCEGRPAQLAWSAATQAAQTADIGGFSDWRIPTAQESIGVLDMSCTEPSLNLDVFFYHRRQSRFLWLADPGIGGAERLIISPVEGAFAGLGEQDQASVRLVRGPVSPSKSTSE